MINTNQKKLGLLATVKKRIYFFF